MSSRPTTPVRSSPPASLLGNLVLPLAVAVVYVAAAKLGMTYWTLQKNVTLIWPPTGIAIAGLFLYGNRVLPGIALGACVANAMTGAPWVFVLAATVGNSLEALLGVWLLNRVTGFQPSMERVRDVLALAVAAVLSPIPSATLGVAGLSFIGRVSWSSFARVWFEWWVGNATGVQIVAPVLFTWLAASSVRWGGVRISLGLLGAAVLAGMTQFAFGGLDGARALEPPLAQGVIVLLVLTAFHFGQRGAATAVLIVSAIAVATTARGQGPFVVESPSLSLLFSISFILTCAFTATLLAAVLAERTEAERALRERESRYRTLVEAAPICIHEIDCTGRLLSMNRAGLDMLGLKEEAEVVGRSVVDVAAESDRDQLWRWFADALDGKTLHFDYQTVEGRTFQSSFVPLRDARGNTQRLMGLSVDITQRVRAEENTRRQEAELAHVARINTMGEMASGLAHELNQPLTAVVNYSQGALRRLAALPPADAEVVDAIGRASREAYRAAEIIRGLARFVQKREPRHSLFPLNTAVREVMGLAAAEVRNHRAFVQMELALDDPVVLADNVQVQQVLLNFVRNGLEAMDSDAADDRILKVRTVRVGREVLIAVSDRGSGLSAEAQGRLFQPFFSTKPLGMGMGMGLSISRSIVEAHGGRIGVVPNPDRGVTFEFTLPLSAEGATHGPRADRVRGG